MSRPFISAALLACCLASTLAGAQALPETESSENAEQDLGVLQAELARTEAERQRLEEELASGDFQRLDMLEQQNSDLREALAEAELERSGQLEQERQRWYMIGGATVGGSLLLGFLVGKMGGRRRRKEWLN